MNIKKSQNNLLTLIGLLLIIYFIWFRFIRERLPRNIPFDLTLFSFICLILCCCFFIVKLILIYKYYLYMNNMQTNFNLFKYNKQNHFLLFIHPYIIKLYEPLILLDTKIKQQASIQNLLIYIFKSVLRKYTFNDTSYTQILNYFLINLYPQITLLLFFLIDVFLFKQLALIYLFIPITFISIINTYLLYSMKQYKTQLLLHLNTYYKVHITSDIPEDDNTYFHLNSITWDYDVESSFEKIKHHLTVENFVFYYTDEIINGYKAYNYEGIVSWALLERNPHFISKQLVFKNAENNLLSQDAKQILLKDFNDLMPLLLKMTLFLETYNKKSFFRSKTILVEVIMSLTYLITWVYILIISCYTIHFTSHDYLFLINFQENLEPFSQTRF